MGDTRGPTRGCSAEKGSEDKDLSRMRRRWPGRQRLSRSWRNRTQRPRGEGQQAVHVDGGDPGAEPGLCRDRSLLRPPAVERPARSPGATRGLEMSLSVNCDSKGRWPQGRSFHCQKGREGMCRGVSSVLCDGRGALLLETPLGKVLTAVCGPLQGAG